MCGIVAYIGNKNCKNILINGLKRLEYRGYDSAGIAILASEKGKQTNLTSLVINIVKEAGKIKEIFNKE